MLTAVGIAVQTPGIAISPVTYAGVVTEVRLATGAPSWFADDASRDATSSRSSRPSSATTGCSSHLVHGSRRFDDHPPYLLLLSSPPKLDNVFPRLFVDWFAIGWPPAAAVAWLLALAVAAAAAAWSLRRRLVLA